ncbi:hypothetical protein BO71DRAFT_419028 [Aspergillus ellipticus CBS 707.79]|uniref:Zn(2)-C6 fungal-type domain-containing protein n=1 Tax=Aspergillus ellipticus CBS 707.79 TaxID=1448320 RepID=A0A319DC62_9EURO|nr:hypothetical protein BO71DRAFT_419028 [Aspergillus ellipticus CBS 707.79]
MDTEKPNPRVPVACKVCRKRKRKCDRVQPNCSPCIAKNVECQYISNRRPKRKRDSGYVTGLEVQIEMLKEEVRRLENLNPSVGRPEEISTILLEEPLDESIADEAEHISAPSTSRPKAIDDVSALMWCMKIEDSGEPTFIGPSGNFCFPVAPHISKTTRTNSSGKPMRTGFLDNSIDPQRLYASETTHRKNLIDIFIRLINPVHQFLNIASISQIQQDNLSPQHDLVQTAVLAAGALLSDDPASDAFGCVMASKVEESVLQSCRQYPSVLVIQALSIMCWRELALDQHNMAWMYNSMCGSMLLHLGIPAISLHNPKDYEVELGDQSPNLNTHSIQLRALWSSVFLDRYAAVAAVRTSCLHLILSRSSSFLNALAFDHHCRLWFIHDQYMDRIYSFDFGTLENGERYRLLLDAHETLFSFHRQLDPRVQTGTKNTSPTAILLHIKSHRLCVRSMSTAAAAMVRLIHDYERIADFDKVPLFVPHSVLTAAITLLLNATSKQQILRDQSIRRFRVCYNAIWKMRTRWIKAKKAISLLQQLAQRWEVMIALPLQNGFPLPFASEWYQPQSLSIHGSHQMTSNEEIPQSVGLTLTLSTLSITAMIHRT